jgi:hypothetical protein
LVASEARIDGRSTVRSSASGIGSERKESE